MASSYSTDLKLELMLTGENAGTWGDKTNDNLNLIQQAIAGFESIALSDGGTVTLVMSDAALSNARNMVLKFTGTLTSASTVTIPDSIEKFYIIDLSAVTGVTNLTIKTVSGTGFTAGEAAIVAAYSDGTNLNEIALNTLGGTIGTAQIDDAAITTAKLSNNAVTTAKISNANVTTAKIADNAITSAKISALQVTQAKIANDAVGPDQLSNTAVTPGSYTNSGFTVDAQGRLTAASSGASAGGDSFDYTLAIASPGPVSTTYSPLTPGVTAGIGYAGGGAGNGGTRNDPVRPGGPGGNGGIGFFAVSVPGGLSGQTVNIGGGGGSSQFANVTIGGGGNGGPNGGDVGGRGSPFSPYPAQPTINGLSGLDPNANSFNQTNLWDGSTVFPVIKAEGVNTDALGNTFPAANSGFMFLAKTIGGPGGSPNQSAQNGGPGYMFFWEKNGGGF
jgi:hypothetical protein